MNLLIAHGYILTGTGSNLHVHNLVREWCRTGHTVTLVCQEPRPELLDYVDEAYVLGDDNSTLTLTHRQDTPYHGSCRVFRPDIHGLLPVYTYDHYKGLTVKEFPDFTDAELTRYIDANLTALNTILAAYPSDVMCTNHTVLFPFIVSKLPASVRRRHLVTVHGSALNFTVRPHPRFVPYALDGLTSATRIIVCSPHAHAELEEFLHDHHRPELGKKMSIIPAGVDVSQFQIRAGSRAALVRRFQHRVADKTASGAGRIGKAVFDLDGDLEEQVDRIRAEYDYRHIDRDVVTACEPLAAEHGTIAMFIGKYLWTKGIHLLLLAVPEILRARPDTTFVLAGFGPFREIAEIILACLAANRLDVLQRLLDVGSPLLQNTNGDPLPLMQDVLSTHKARIETCVSSFDGSIADRVIFTGVLTHDELRLLLPCANVLVAPSVFPEAFGMVAVEAMACGAYPIVTYQSAFKDITDQLMRDLADFNLAMRPVELNQDASCNLAHNVLACFDYQDRRDDRPATLQQRLRQLAVDNYSWQGIARRYLHAMQDSGPPASASAPAT